MKSDNTTHDMITRMDIVQVTDFVHSDEIGFDLIGYNQAGEEISSQCYETEAEAKTEKEIFLDPIWKVFFLYA